MSIDVQLGLVTVIMAILGGIVSAIALSVRSQKIGACILFVALGIYGMVLVVMQSKGTAKAQKQFADKFDAMRSEMQKAEIGRQVDTAYLNAKLQDAYTANDDLRKFAPAIMKMAQTSAEFTQRQYEQRTTDNKHLRDMTVGVIKRLRDLEAQYHVASRHSTDALWDAQVAKSNEMRKSGKSVDEMRAQGAIDQQQYLATYTQLRNQYEQVYRNTVMGDAQYCRRELLNRVGEDGLMARERSKEIAIDGILAGPSPIGDAADYLDALVRKLPE